MRRTKGIELVVSASRNDSIVLVKGIADIVKTVNEQWTPRWLEIGRHDSGHQTQRED